MARTEESQGTIEKLQLEMRDLLSEQIELTKRQMEVSNNIIVNINNLSGQQAEIARKLEQQEIELAIVRSNETIARLPGGLSEQIAIKGRSSW